MQASRGAAWNLRPSPLRHSPTKTTSFAVKPHFSSMAYPSPFCSLLPLLFFSFYLTQAHGDEIETLTPAIHSSPTEDLSSSSVQAVTLKVTHHHTHGNLNASDKLVKDSLRVAALHERVKRGSSPGKCEITLPAIGGDTIANVDYLVTIGYGTPAAQQTVLFDTGSGVNWIQCKPCLGFCYNQTDPIFNPFKSSSYRNLSCSSKPCRDLPVKTCTGGTCLYFIRYADNSMTAGFLATERFTLSPNVAFKNFVFGCGERNEGLFAGFAGLLGLARSPLSVISQVSRKLGDAFSYCLPAPGSPAGHLTIGGSNKKISASASYTPMITNQQEPSLYFLNLKEISVNGRPLQITPGAFKSGTIIDSGTIITRLPPSVYSALRKAFRNAMWKYRPTVSVDLLDTCYELRHVENVAWPSVTLHYDGADVVLGPSAVAYGVDASRLCLGFAGNEREDDLSIIGNVQQRGMEVIYDVGGERIGFAPGDCA